MGAGPLKQIVSIFISTMIVMLGFLGCVPQLVMYARADTQLELNAGNITLQLSDAGRFWDVEVDLGASTLNPLVDFQQHFFFYHDGYGADTVAALYPPLPTEDGDFEVIGGVDVPLGWEETGSTQKIYGTW